MRPENSHKRDVIDTLLEKSWESPPTHLEKQLMAIPTEISLVPSHSLDRFSFILNAILILWGAGLVMFFWTPLAQMIASISQNMLGYSGISPQILSHPIVGVLTLICLLAGWVWMDIERHPRATQFRVTK